MPNLTPYIPLLQLIVSFLSVLVVAVFAYAGVWSTNKANISLGESKADKKSVEDLGAKLEKCRDDFQAQFDENLLLMKKLIKGK